MGRCTRGCSMGLRCEGTHDCGVGLSWALWGGSTHGCSMGQSQAVRDGCTSWLWHGGGMWHGGAQPSITPGTYFICLTMVLFPDSPAPVGTKQGSQQSHTMGTPDHALCWPPGTSTARGHWWLCQVCGMGWGDYSLVLVSIKVGLSCCG